jgi:predicted nucleic acid-binding protein
VRYLLDTCVISELISKQPDEQLIEWIDGIEDQLMCLSVITLGEIKRGIEKLPGSGRKNTLDKWLKEDLLIRFDDRILAIDLPVMLVWGTLVAHIERQGKPLPAINSMIAAIALYHDLQVVTRNEQDFAGMGVAIVNPWSS